MIDSIMTQKDVMERYPRLTAHLIAESLGYFTPKSAANAIICHKAGRPFGCEWYMSIAGKKDRANKKFSIVDIGKEVIKSAFSRRQCHRGYMAEYATARTLVNLSIKGNDPILASWF